MCGIFAMFSLGEPLDPEVLERATARLHHRGPDGRATWLAPDRLMGLGHTRLAIVAPQAGAQPMSDEHGDLHLVVNGEFYGYKSIQHHLRQKGYRLRTPCDSEIALHLFREHGTAFTAHLRGEFALILADQRRRRLIAVRDRFGIKPLFYTFHRNVLYLASEIKALWAAGVPARWDSESFYDYLHLGFSSDRSFFQNIHQVPPGHLLRIDEGGLRLEAYWDLDYPTHSQLEDGIRESSFIDELRHRLEESVRLRLEADVPVCFHLSGGLDSSSIAGVAAKQGLPLNSFTVGFEGEPYDERPLARRTADFWGARHHTLDFQLQAFATHAKDAVRHGEALQENAHGVARYLQSRDIHRAGFKVVLAGEGGDELFAGYGHFQKDLDFCGSPSLQAKTRASFEVLARSGNAPPLAELWRRLDFVPNWILERYMSVTLPIKPFLRPEFAATMAARNPYGHLLDQPAIGRGLEARTPFHQSLYLFNKTWLPNYLLFAERLDMCHAVEVRLPLLDHHLFDLVKKTPLALYRAHGQGKYPLRRAMKPYVIEPVLQEEKRPFFAPPLTSEPRILDFIHDQLHHKALDDNPFFDPHKLRSGLEGLWRTTAGRGYGEAVLHILLGTGFLQREYVSQAPG